MNKKSNTKTTIILAVIILLLGITPIGLIPIGFINLTILHIPLIIGAILLNRKESIILGFVFGFVSSVAAFGVTFASQSGMVQYLLNYSPLAVVIVSIIPRMLIPIVTNIIYSIFVEYYGSNPSRYQKSFSIIVAAVSGSFTNTIGYLGLMGIFFNIYGIGDVFSQIYSFPMLLGIICEALTCTLICTPVILFVSHEKSQKTSYSFNSIQAAEKIQEETDNDEIEGAIAVIPSSDSLLPKLNDIMQKRCEKCIKYIDKDNIQTANIAFDAFISYFNSDADFFNVSLYAILCFINASKYRTAAERLSKLLKNIPHSMLTPENKDTLISILVIINSSNQNGLEPGFDRVEADSLYRETRDFILSERMSEAADRYLNYISYTAIADRVIEKYDIDYYEDIQPAAIFCTQQTNNVAMISGDVNEGVTELNITNLPTADSLCNDIPSQYDSKKALAIRRAGYADIKAFDELINSINDPEIKIKADLLAAVANFEANNYALTLKSMIDCMKRGYDTSLLLSIKPTMDSLFTIVHMSAINLCENEQTAAEINRIKTKVDELYSKGAIILAAQLLDKYFVLSGLAKYC